MSTDYKKLCKELFGTTDVNKLKSIADTLHSKNPRRAGRKRAFSNKQISEMLEMQSKNIPQTEIAKRFGTTRQTIARYLNDSAEKEYNMQIDYMFKASVCTTIYIDFKNEKINIINKTDDILHRAFGVNEKPSWDDFMTFLKDRCFPESRGDKKMLLQLLGIDSYDPLQIVEKTKGKTCEDNQWMKFKYRSTSYGNN